MAPLVVFSSCGCAAPAAGYVYVVVRSVPVVWSVWVWRLPVTSNVHDSQYFAGPPSPAAVGAAVQSPLPGVHAAVSRRRWSEVKHWVSAVPPGGVSAIFVTLPA